MQKMLEMMCRKAENVVAENAGHVTEYARNVNEENVVAGNVTNAQNVVNVVANEVVHEHV